MILFIVIMCVLAVPDLFIRFDFQGHVLKTQWASLVLYYLLFKYRLRKISIALLFFSFLFTAFSEVRFLQIFASYFFILLLFYRLREELYAESVYFKIFWVFCMSTLQHTILTLLHLPWPGSEGLLSVLGGSLINAVYLSLYVWPFFWVFYKLEKQFLGKGYQDKGFGIGLLEGRSKKNKLL